MRDFSKVSPSLHNSDRFRALGRDYMAKHVYQYLLTCPHGTSTGVYVLKDGYACDDLDMELDVYREAIDSLCKVGLIAYDKATKTVFIAKWLDHNPPTNPKHAIGMLSILGKCGDGDLFFARFQELAAIMRAKGMTREPSIRNAIDTLSQRYQKGIPTLDQTETRQRLDVVDQTETREISRQPPRPPATLTGGGLTAVVMKDPTVMPQTVSIDDPERLYRKLATLGDAIKNKPSSKLLETPLMKRAVQ